jgi:drug/metabolite transporter (DMT)-like permease
VEEWEPPESQIISSWLLVVHITAIFLGLATALLWGVADFLSRQPSREIGYYLTTAYVQISSFLVTLVYALFLGYLNLPLIYDNGNLVALAVVIGIIAYAGFLFIFRGYSLGNMAIVAPIAGSYPAITALLSFLVLGVVLLPVQTYALTLTIVGIVLSGTRFSEYINFRKKFAKNSSPPPSATQSGEGLSLRTRLIVGADSALMSALCGGTAFFLLGYVTPVMGPVIPPLIIKAVGLVFGFALVAALRMKFRMPTNLAIFWLFVIGVLDGLGFVTVNTGILEAGRDLPIVVTMAALTSVVTPMLASIFYKEKLEKIQVLGVVLIIVGVASIVYF